MLKHWNGLVLGLSVIMISAPAFAAGSPRADRLATDSQRLVSVEAQLNANDAQALDYYLGGIEAILAHYAPAPAPLICVSNGQSGIYERFSITDPSTGKSYGGETTIDTCNALVAHARPTLMCLSNGQSGIYEAFHLYNRNLDRQLGGDTSLEQCLSSLN